MTKKTKEKDNYNARFTKYVLKQDEVSIVLKCHLFLEQTIEKLINKIATRPEIILKDSFKRKVDFLFIVGAITDSIHKDLLLINSIRNKFSHTIKYKFTKQDFKNIFSISRDFTPPPEIQGHKNIIFFMAAVSLINLNLRLLQKATGPNTRKILLHAIDEIRKEKDK